mgnify:FL=1
MKIVIISSEEFFVFVNSVYAKISDYSDKEEIIDVTKSIISKISTRLRMRGFYKIKVLVDPAVGLFIEGVQLENLERVNAVDLRVIVYFNEDIYFKTSDYFIIGDVPKVRYFDGDYYCLTRDIPDINKVIEFGEFVYGSSILKMLYNSSFV